MENSNQNLFTTLKKKCHLISRKQKCQKHYFLRIEKRDTYMYFFFFPSPRLFIFSLYYKNPIENCKKNSLFLKVSLATLTLLNTLFRLEAEIVVCTEGSPRLCSCGSPGVCGANSIPFQHLQLRHSDPTFLGCAQSRPRLTFKELRSMPNTAELKFMFCRELFIGQII